MEEKNLAAIMALFDRSEAVVLDLEEGNLHLRLEKTGASPAPVCATVPAGLTAAPASLTAPAAQEAAEEKAEEAEPEGRIFPSALVGIFHAAPAPGSSPFVQSGDAVKEGQVLCIIESMKVMNEICSDGNGRIGRIFAGEGDLIEFGQPLFEILEEEAAA